MDIAEEPNKRIQLEEATKGTSLEGVDVLSALKNMISKLGATRHGISKLTTEKETLLQDMDTVRTLHDDALKILASYTTDRLNALKRLEEKYQTEQSSGVVDIKH
ncbi:hypothetical protein ACHAPI_011809 [Fusarium lateritium]